MMSNDKWCFIAWILVIIGGIDWLFVGLFDVNIIGAIFGVIIGRIIYVIVGIAACYLIYMKVQKKQSTTPQ